MAGSSVLIATLTLVIVYCAGEFRHEVTGTSDFVRTVVWITLIAAPCFAFLWIMELGLLDRLSRHLDELLVTTVKKAHLAPLPESRSARLVRTTTSVLECLSDWLALRIPVAVLALVLVIGSGFWNAISQYHHVMIDNYMESYSDPDPLSNIRPVFITAACFVGWLILRCLTWLVSWLLSGVERASWLSGHSPASQERHEV